MLGAERVYHQRWLGRSPKRTDADVQEFLLNRFQTVTDIRNRWRCIEQDVRTYLRDVRDETLAQPLTYVNLQGDTWTYPLWRILLNVITHQAYHRGQVTVQLRLLGAQAAGVDFLIAHDLAFKV